MQIYHSISSFVVIILVAHFRISTELSTRFDIPSFSELISTAVHLYGPPTASDDQSHQALPYLYPCVNFICSGRIRKLFFVANTTNDMSNQQIMPPEFSLLREHCHERDEECNHQWFALNTTAPQYLRLVLLNGTVGMYELMLSPQNSFREGDVLVVHHPRSGNGTSVLTLLYQSGGGFCETLTCPMTIASEDECIRGSVFPFIAIKTDTPSSRSCAVGFLKRESLELILNAPTDDGITNSISFRSDTVTVAVLNQSMPINESGQLVRFLIAAKFNHSGLSGWPDIQIVRRRSPPESGTYPTIMSSGEPRFTGYLNVFEYTVDLQGSAGNYELYEIKDGDEIHVMWPLLINRPQYSLAYIRERPKVMVSLDISDRPIQSVTKVTLSPNNNANITSSSSDNMYSYSHQSHYGSASSATTPETNTSMSGSSSGTSEHSMTTDVSSIAHTIYDQKRQSETTTAIIIGGVLCSITVLILILVVITVVIVYRLWNRKKIFTPNQDTGDNSVFSRSPAPLHNPNYSLMNPNLLSGCGGQRTYTSNHDGTDSLTSAILPQNINPSAQDDYYYSKLYEWGVFVPTVDQREAASEVLTNTTEIDSIYSTLGESQYSTLLQFNHAPAFFAESDEDYWMPASDTKGLYEQLSSKKYREILRNQIQIFDQLGSGQFGNVMKGVWLLSGGSKDIAVKILKEGTSEEDKVKFIQEAAINGQFWHPNIIKLMGVVTIGEPTMIILEYLSNGDLRSYLIKIKPIPGEMSSSNTSHTLLRFCKEIAAGMKYLEQKKFIHRDLAARNILLSEEKICKISDFGMSRDLENDSYYVSRGGMIPVKWTAPEALHYKKYSSLSDVWSFGCVTYEIWSLGHKPFEGYSNREVMRKIDSGFRLPPPPGCPRDIYYIMIQCWHPNKNLRPSFSDLYTSLSDPAFSLQMKESPESDQLHLQAHTIGAPLEAGKELFTDL